MMKTTLQARFLQHLVKKNHNQGFTLIELLVVIIIIGILSAIALPSFLGQAAKARASEGKSNIGVINRAQQATYLEQSKFSDDIHALGLSIPATSKYFTYSIAANGDIKTGVTNTAKPTADAADVKGYAGGVFYDSGAKNTVSILCEANSPGATNVAGAPVFTAGASGAAGTVACNANSKQIQ